MYPSSSCRLMRAPMAGPKRAAILGGKKRSAGKSRVGLCFKGRSGSVKQKSELVPPYELGENLNPNGFRFFRLCFIR